MRETGGRIVLLDFGLVAADPAVDAEGALESTGGTPLYMAPEVLRRGPATVTSDVYSLGVLLYRLVSGRYPIEATRLSEIVSAMDEGRRTPSGPRSPRLHRLRARRGKGDRAGPRRTLPKHRSDGAGLDRFREPGRSGPPLVAASKDLGGWNDCGCDRRRAPLGGAPPRAAALRRRGLDVPHRDGRADPIMTGSTVLPGDELHLRVTRAGRPAPTSSIATRRESPAGLPPEAAEATPILSGGRICAFRSMPRAKR